MSSSKKTGQDAVQLDKHKVLLATAFRHGQEIQRLTVLGDSYEKLAAYAAEHNEITEASTEYGHRLIFAEVVHWEVTVDDKGAIIGISQSGYAPLMERLGIDFSGAPFGEDCG